MKTIWKCKFCNETHIKRSKILKHETKCTRNPDNKLCFTCSRFLRGSNFCSMNIRTFNVYTSGIPCPDWFPVISEPV